MPEKVILSWSGGKDSAMALYELQKNRDYEVVALLTSVAAEFQRISHHGVRVELLEQQARAIGLPLQRVILPSGPNQPCTNEIYEQVMEQALRKFPAEGVTVVAFGDLFLQDLREYRERNLAKVGMRGLFPIWHRDTTELVHSFIRLGFKARLSCVEGKLGRAFAGRSLDADLIASLPDGTDPCGEYGEYHSFVYEGPVFRQPVSIQTGEIVLRDTRYYADLLPGDMVRPDPPQQLEIPPVCQAAGSEMPEDCP
jgi:uncharacterized protein (TIGR00290 family)